MIISIVSLTIKKTKVFHTKHVENISSGDASFNQKLFLSKLISQTLQNKLILKILQDNGRAFINNLLINFRKINKAKAVY